jgi:hypothetical protein
MFKINLLLLWRRQVSHDTLLSHFNPKHEKNKSHGFQNIRRREKIAKKQKNKFLKEKRHTETVMCVRVCVWVCVCVCVWAWVCVCLFVYMCACMCVCVWLSLYVCDREGERARESLIILLSFGAWKITPKICDKKSSLAVN